MPLVGIVGRGDPTRRFTTSPSKPTVLPPLLTQERQETVQIQKIGTRPTHGFLNGREAAPLEEKPLISGIRIILIIKYMQKNED